MPRRSSLGDKKVPSKTEARIRPSNCDEGKKRGRTNRSGLPTN